ncbi:MAG TPA: hypothetical protein VIP77_13835 [Jiangellaceae bacterium]
MADKLAAAFHGASLTDTLRPILAAYRAEVQPHWSAATAHPDYEGAAGSPVGQCGVTSAWLQRRLAEDHGLEVRYCTGTRIASPTDLGSSHCWLELLYGATLVIDLTADQFPNGEPITFASYAEIASSGVWYVTRHDAPASEMATDPVQPRLAILTEAVGR